MSSMYSTASHEWILVDEGIGTVGITAKAQKELGDIVYVDLPKVGQTLKKGDVACVLESTKAAIDIDSPVSGQVIKVNEDLSLNPGLINSEKNGWLFQLELSDVDELAALSRKEAY